MGWFISKFFTGGKDQINEVKNIAINTDGTLFSFNTYLEKPLKPRQKWFNGSEYFASTVGLYAGVTLAIEGEMFRVMRVDRKRDKIWIGPLLPYPITTPSKGRKK